MRTRLIIFTRTLVTLAAGCALLFAGIYMLASGLGLVPSLLIDRAGFSMGVDVLARPYPERMWWLSIASLLTLAGVLVTSLAVIRSELRGPRSFFIQDRAVSVYEGLRVSISQPSLCALIAYEAQRIPGIYDIQPQIELSRRGWKVACRLSVLKGVELPVLLPMFKQRLHEALEHHTGIPVGRLDVHTQHDTINHSGVRRLR